MDERRAWAYYRLQWPARKIAAELGEDEAAVQAVVASIRQDPARQHQLLHDSPPPDWEMFPPPGPDDDATPPSGWPAVADAPRRRRRRPLHAVAALFYRARHAAPRRPRLARGTRMIIDIALIGALAAVLFMLLANR